MIEKFKEKNKIKKSKDNETKLFQQILNKGGMSDKELILLQNSELIDKVDFNEVKLKNSAEEKGNPLNIKPKYYL